MYILSYEFILINYLHFFQFFDKSIYLYVAIYLKIVSI